MGTPYVWGSCERGVGVDCGHLFEGVLSDAGLLPSAHVHRVRPSQVEEGVLLDIIHGRSLDLHPAYRVAWMAQGRPKVGDLLVIGVGDHVPSHTAIWTGTRIIHAWHEGEEQGRVIESVLPARMNILEIGRILPYG